MTLYREVVGTWYRTNCEVCGGRFETTDPDAGEREFDIHMRRCLAPLGVRAARFGLISTEGNPMHKYDVVRHDETATTIDAERFEVDDRGDVRFYQDDNLTAFMSRPIAVVLEPS